MSNESVKERHGTSHRGLSCHCDATFCLISIITPVITPVVDHTSSPVVYWGQIGGPVGGFGLGQRWDGRRCVCSDEVSWTPAHGQG